MKVEMLSNTIIVYLLDNKKYNEDSDIKKILINVFDNLKKYYNITFDSDYNLELYINRYYGMILEITENEDFKKSSISRIKNSKKSAKRKNEELNEILNFLNEKNASEYNQIMTHATKNKFKEL